MAKGNNIRASDEGAIIWNAWKKHVYECLLNDTGEQEVGGDAKGDEGVI
jgi:hypothetical protein